MAASPKARLLAAVRQAAKVVDVPGAPRSLRLDDVQVAGDSMALHWSFVDPEVQGLRVRARRLRGTVAVQRSSWRGADRSARAWWAQAQLEAARRYRLQVDADWVPGEPFRPHRYEVAEAWGALLTHLGSYGAEVHDERGEIRVGDGDEVTVYRIDPEAWASYLNEPGDIDPDSDPDIVPSASPLVDGLPLWAVDDLTEATGAWGPVIGLVDGRLVGLDDGPEELGAGEGGSDLS